MSATPRHKAPPRPPPPCSGCGRIASLTWRRFTTYDATSHTYVCGDCRDRSKPAVSLTCRRCGKQRSFKPSAATARDTVQDGPNGQTYMCRPCQGRETLRHARTKLLTRYGVTPSDDADTRLAAMQEHAARMVTKGGGRAKVLELANAARANGISDRGRERLSLGLLASKPRPGTFQLCHLCRKLLYLPPSRQTQGAVGFHAECHHEWQRSEVYQRWLREIGSPSDPMRDLRIQRLPRPLPPAPRGRQPTSEQLGRQLRWLIRHFGLGDSWREIGQADHIDHANVRRGVLALIPMLPDSWVTVFGGRRTGRMLDKHLSIDRLRRLST